jgi:hypothetical protein
LTQQAKPLQDELDAARADLKAARKSVEKATGKEKPPSEGKS